MIENDEEISLQYASKSIFTIGSQKNVWSIIISVVERCKHNNNRYQIAMIKTSDEIISFWLDEDRIRMLGVLIYCCCVDGDANCEVLLCTHMGWDKIRPDDDVVERRISRLSPAKILNESSPCISHRKNPPVYSHRKKCLTEEYIFNNTIMIFE